MTTRNACRTFTLLGLSLCLHCTWRPWTSPNYSGVTILYPADVDVHSLCNSFDKVRLHALFWKPLFSIGTCGASALFCQEFRPYSKCILLVFPYFQFAFLLGMRFANVLSYLSEIFWAHSQITSDHLSLERNTLKAIEEHTSIDAACQQFYTHSGLFSFCAGYYLQQP